MRFLDVGRPSFNPRPEPVMLNLLNALVLEVKFQQMRELVPMNRRGFVDQVLTPAVRAQLKRLRKRATRLRGG